MLRFLDRSGRAAKPEQAHATDINLSQTTPFCSVSKGILSELKHIDLSDRVDLKSTKVVSLGAHGDICKGILADNDGTKVAIAIKRLRFCLKEDVKILFEQEIYVWSKLQHPNVHALLGYAYDDVSGFPLLISKWMDNGSAWTYVNSNPCCDVLKLALDIAEGLTYLHKQGVIHRDIKSDNILITSSEDAVICDFGCSRIIDGSRTLGNLTTGIKGTAHYLAFELLALSGQYPRHSEKSDVWAFGMTIYELLARHRPYQNMSALQVPLAIIQMELPSLSFIIDNKDVSDDVKEALYNICQTCWIHDPFNRPSMDSVLEEVRFHFDLRNPPLETPATKESEGDLKEEAQRRPSISSTIQSPLLEDRSPIKRARNRIGSILHSSLKARRGSLDTLSPEVHPSAYPPEIPLSREPCPLDLVTEVGIEEPVYELTARTEEDIDESRQRILNQNSPPSPDTLEKDVYKAKAIYSYDAAPNRNELSFKQGEILDLIDGRRVWWKVKNKGGVIGLAPSNYLIRIGAPYLPLNIDTTATTATSPLTPKAKALYPYTASLEDPNEISFNKGDILYVLNDSGNWWSVKRQDGAVGVASSNYLQLLYCKALTA